MIYSSCVKKVLVPLLLMSSSVSHAELFQKDTFGLGLAIGGGSVVVENKVQYYTVAGISGDYFVLDNLSLGLGYLGWFGASPTMNQLTLSSNYYIPLDEKYTPFFGLFIRETFVSGDYDDYDSYGARAGLSVKLSQNSYLAIGFVQEYYGTCRWQDTCSSSYPELRLSFSF